MINKNPVSVRAVIINNGRVLTLRREFDDGVIIWTFPGGHLEESDQNEKEALARECLEEVNVEITIDELFFTQKFKGKTNKFYLCKILKGEVGKGHGPEYSEPHKYHGSHHPQWLEIKDLVDYDLRPKELRDKIMVLYKNEKDK